jgi:hypothetical protein
MKNLLTLTAVIEAGTGLVLVMSPSLLSILLLASSLVTPAELMVGRIAGAALIALGAACWLAHKDARSRAATGLVAAMLLYNLAAVSIFASAGFSPGPVGIALWPAVILHTAMAVWCIACLRGKQKEHAKI